MLRRRELALAATALAAAGPQSLRAAPAAPLRLNGAPTSLRPPEPMAQLHAAADGTLWAVARSGVLWRWRDSLASRRNRTPWLRVAEGIDADTPLASGHGRVAARTLAGRLWVLALPDSRGAAAGSPAASPNTGQATTSALAPHAGLLVLPGAVIGVVAVGDAHHLARFEVDGTASWREVARSVAVVLPDARPIQFDPAWPAPRNATRSGTGVRPSPTAGGDAPIVGANAAGGLVVFGAPDAARYRHGVLGDAIEPTALLQLDRHSLRVTGRMDLPVPYVFEDIAPRPVEYGTGRALLTVRSGPQGAQLLIVAADPADGLQVAAAGAPLGTLHRWMAPTTDGTRLAAVHTPHIDGTLQHYRPAGDQLLADPVVRGVTNHVIGTRTLDIGAWQGDVLYLPTQDRLALRRFDWAGAAPVEQAPRLLLPAPAMAVHAGLGNTRAALGVLLADGDVVALTR